MLLYLLIGLDLYHKDVESHTLEQSQARMTGPKSYLMTRIETFDLASKQPHSIMLQNHQNILENRQNTLATTLKEPSECLCHHTATP